MRLKKRQKLFIRYYMDRSDKECYGNATNSATKAGYSEPRAASQGCNLLKSPLIREEIARQESIETEKHESTKEQAIQETRVNYLAAKTDAMKKYWNDWYYKLKGWDVIKTENKTTIKDITPEESDMILDKIRELRKRSLN